MVVIAVAGGTGGVGRTVVDGILAAGKHEVKILGRKPNPELEEELGVPIIAVNYADIQALTKVLEDNNVHTVISALSMLPNDEPNHEIDLIHAADASSTTKRIASSDWGIRAIEEDADRLATVPLRLAAQAELRKTKNLEYTVFLPGYFLDYFGLPVVKSHMKPFTVVVDIPNNAASIPGSGDTPVVLTHTTDVAKFVAASLDLEKWEPESYIIGDKVTWNEVVALAEAAKGTKFNVAYDSVEKLKSGQITELPAHVPLHQFVEKSVLQKTLITFSLWFAEGAFDLKPEKSLNDVFPDIKTMKVGDVLEKAWKNT